MEYPKNCRYTKQHVWVSVDGGIATTGITEYAQGELGEIVFVELPEKDAQFETGSSFGVVESTKTASDVYTPLAGRVVEVNETLSDTPSTVNEDPYGKGWLAKFADFDASQLDSLMTADEYSDFVGK